jgi:pSer/pThr/pTyr-binding forkhead associated (FHA) protein
VLTGREAAEAASGPGPGVAPVVLHVDSGDVVAVAATLVIGRNPDAGRGGPDARAVRIPDDTRSLSKTHATVRPAGDGIEVVDLHSTNGTVLVRDGVESPLAAGVPVVAVPGDTIRIGDRTLAVARA